jgi:hypothetical protein
MGKNTLGQLDATSFFILDRNPLLHIGQIVKKTSLELNRNLFFVDDYAVSHRNSSLNVDLGEMEPHQTAFRIQLCFDKHSAESLLVTGSREEDDKQIYQETYDALCMASDPLG